MENQLLDSDLIGYKDGKSLSEILNNGYETHAVDYIKKGFEIFKQNILFFLGFFAILIVINFVANVIPMASIFVSLLMIPLSAGIYIVAKKIDYNEQYSFSNFFDGYKIYQPLIIASFIQFLIAIVLVLICCIPVFVILGISFFSNMQFGNIDPTKIGLLLLMFFILFLVFSLIFINWIFANKLIIFSDKEAWESMQISRKIISKKLFNWVGFLLLLMLFNLAGAICFGIGLLVTIPTSSIAMYVAYNDVVGMNLRD